MVSVLDESSWFKSYDHLILMCFEVGPACTYEEGIASDFGNMYSSK